MAVGQHDAAAARRVLRGVKGVPAPADKGFKPGVQIHRLEPLQIAHHHARRNLQGAAQRDADMGKVAAHAGALGQRVQRVGAGRADAVAVGQVVLDPCANFFNLRIARWRIAHQRQRLLLHHVRRAIAALQQVVQHVVGQFHHRCPRRVGRHRNVGFHFHRHLDGDAHLALRHRQALAQVAVVVDKLAHRHPGLQIVAIADDPLRRAAARAQHGNHRAVRRGGHQDGAGGFELHGEPVVDGGGSEKPLRAWPCGARGESCGSSEGAFSAAAWPQNLSSAPAPSP